MIVTITFIVICVALLAAAVMQRRGAGSIGMRRSGGLLNGGLPGGSLDLVEGSLTITGVSDRPQSGDKDERMFCTISGTIMGPDTEPTDVYGHTVISEHAQWPRRGERMPVVYKPGKAETSWRFAGTLEPPNQ